MLKYYDMFDIVTLYDTRILGTIESPTASQPMQATRSLAHLQEDAIGSQPQALLVRSCLRDNVPSGSKMVSF